ncbi:MAG: hypothetical protein H7Y20_05635, partial [Bryobacteraceae bacterium]|nr:hypothetical protein [Bryobacteraceae bacterium]
MKFALIAVAAFFTAAFAAPSTAERPHSGKVDIMKLSDVRPGMKGTAWTTFQGVQPEPVPVELIGVWKNAWGPRQDIILCRMGGKVIDTGVAGGMSGSPVYVDGKLVGAVSLRIGAFTKEPICGITPIELMLDINELDWSRPSDARLPGGQLAQRAGIPLPSEVLAQAVSAGVSQEFSTHQPLLQPIDTPVLFSGFHDNVLREFGSIFRQLGVTPVQGGASGALKDMKPSGDWKKSLQPGDPIAAVLVSGDMSVTALGTTTYNDGKRVLGFGHQFLNLGPVDIPMATGDVLLVLGSSFQPTKLANATGVVGSLKQDRHSGIMGELGSTSEMIPVSVKVRTFGDGDKVKREKELHFNVFVEQKWTPYLMMATLFNSISGVNDFAEEATYRLTGDIELEGQTKISLNTMLAPGEMPVPASMVLAGWWGDKFNRLYGNSVKVPRLQRVNAVVDLLPQRRVATLESAWVPNAEVDAGTEVPVKVFLRPYRGERLEREIKVRIPAGLPKGEHRILLSDADTANRILTAAGQANRFIDLPETVSLINQERSNNR